MNDEDGPVTVASGSSATFTCDSGYTLTGDNTRLCTASVLAGTLATCAAGKTNRLSDSQPLKYHCLKSQSYCELFI